MSGMKGQTFYMGLIHELVLAAECNAAENGPDEMTHVDNVVQALTGLVGGVKQYAEMCGKGTAMTDSDHVMFVNGLAIPIQPTSNSYATPTDKLAAIIGMVASRRHSQDEAEAIEHAVQAIPAQVAYDLFLRCPQLEALTPQLEPTEWDFALIGRKAQGLPPVGPLTRAQHKSELAYEAWCEECAAENEARSKAGGRTICPECGNRSVKHQTVCTYGRPGVEGSDFSDYGKCETPGCGHTEM